MVLLLQNGRCYEAEISAILLLLEMLFLMISCFAKIEIFPFWPKTMDYSPRYFLSAAIPIKNYRVLPK